MYTSVTTTISIISASVDKPKSTAGVPKISISQKYRISFRLSFFANKFLKRFPNIGQFGIKDCGPVCLKIIAKWYEKNVNKYRYEILKKITSYISQ